MSTPNSIFEKIPFLRYTLGFITGIIISNQTEITPIVYLSIVILGIVCLIIFHKKAGLSISKNKFFSFLTALVFFSLGSIYTTYYNNIQFNNNCPNEASFYGRIDEISNVSNDRGKYLVKLISAQNNDSTIHLNENILLYNYDFDSNRAIQIGSHILFKSKLYEINNGNNPGEFDYQKFMYNKGIRYQCFNKKKISIISKNKKTIKNIALICRSKLLQQFEKAGIKGDEFAVLSALTLGEKNHLTSEIKRSFSNTGAMHILAVSGLHVGIIYYIFSFLLNFIFKSKKLKLIKIVVFIILLWSYAFITGLSPSVLRTCTMFSFIVIGENLNRKSNIYNTIALSAFVLVLIQPNVIYDVGFQLSYSAVISIVFFQPKIASFLSFRYFLPDKLWKLFTVAIAAQIGTFALSIYYFHQFPVYFWLSNFIVIPFASIIIYLSLSFFMTLSIPIVSNFIAIILSIVLKILNKIIQFIENLPGAIIENIWIDNITLLLLFIAIPLIGYVFIKNSKHFIYTLLIASIIIVSNSLLIQFHTQNQQLIIFFNSYAEPIVSIIDGDQHYYYTTSDSIQNNTKALLNQASAYFKTNQAININTQSKKSTSILKKESYIIYNEFVINIMNNLYSNCPDKDKSDLIWNYKEKEVQINNLAKVDVGIIKKGKLITLKNRKQFKTFKMNKNGAIIIILKNKRVNSH